MIIRKEGLIESAHDVSEGGLFVALMEKAMQSGLGLTSLLIRLSEKMPTYLAKARAA